MDKCAKTLAAAAATVDKLRKRTIPPVYTSSKIRLGESSPSIRQTSSKAHFCSAIDNSQTLPRAVRSLSLAAARRQSGYNRRSGSSTIHNVHFRGVGRESQLPTTPDASETQPCGVWGTGAVSYKVLAPNSELAHLKICSVMTRREETATAWNKSKTARRKFSRSSQRCQRRCNSSAHNANANNVALLRRTPQRTRQGSLPRTASTVTNRGNRQQRRSAKKQRQIKLRSSPLCTQGGNVWKNLTLASSLGRTEKGGGDTTLDTTI